MYVVACSSSSSVLAIAGLENSRGPQHFTGLDALNGLELSRVVVSAKTFIHHQRPVGAGGAWGAMASPDFRRSVNPISKRGQIMPTTLILAPPDFQHSYGSADIYRVWCAKQQPLLATSGALHFLVSSKHPVDSVSSTSGLS